jgi:hypothetical protein
MEGRVCAIKGCTQLCQKDAHVCSDPEHVKAEQIHVERGQARFQLKSCLERARVSHLNDSITEDCMLDDVADDEAEQEIEIAAALQNHACDADIQHK